MEEVDQKPKEEGTAEQKPNVPNGSNEDQKIVQQQKQPGLDLKLNVTPTEKKNGSPNKQGENELPKSPRRIPNEE